MHLWVRRLLLSLAILLLPLPAIFGIAKGWRWAQWHWVGEQGVALIEPVAVRGTKHVLFVRGLDRRKPVLLFLPGGPGESMVPLAREFTGDLERDFVVAHVEFGVGKGQQYRSAPSLSQFTDDAEALIDHLRARFGGKVFLVGHSLGSIQALTIAARSPEKVAAMASVGQTVDWRFGNRLAAKRLRSLATARGDSKTLSELARLPADLADPEDQLAIDFAAVQRQRELLRVQFAMGGRESLR